MLEAAVISLIVCLCIYRIALLRELLEKIVTTISQSGSAVFVIIIGLVAGKAPTISESIGGLVDVTITTNVEFEFGKFDMETVSILMASVGATLFGIKKKDIRQTGIAVFGLAVLAGAILGHITFASFLKEMTWFDSIGGFFNDHLVYAAMVGAIIRFRKIVIGIIAILFIIGTLELDTALVIFLGAYIRVLIESCYAEKE